MRRPSSPFSRRFLTLAVGLLTPLCASVALSSDPIQFDQRTSDPHVKVIENGTAIQIDVQKSSPKYNASVRPREQYTAGWHKITAEYKTRGFSPLSSFVLHVNGLEPGCLSPFQKIQAATAWSPIEVYFHLKNDGKIITTAIVEPAMQGISDNAEIQIRNMRIDSYQTPSDTELLVNGDFAIGTLGEIPPMWDWQYNGVEGDYALVADDTFRTGTQTLEIKADDKPRTLAGFGHPLETRGTMEFTVWAKSEQGATMTLRLLGNNYKWDASKTVNLNGSWTKYTLSKACPAGIDPSLCLPRVDIKGEGTARIAGCSLIWKGDRSASTHQPAVTPYWMNRIAELAIGAQPAAGGAAVNLLENPDFDLGWNGWLLNFYGTSSPAAYTEITTAPECSIVPDGGADGGNAMYISSGVSLVSKAFPIVKGKTYTLSVDVKALSKNSTLKMFIIDPGWKIKAKNCTELVEGEWKRVSMKIVWDYDSVQKKAYARYDGKEVLLDKAQLTEDDVVAYQKPPLSLGVLAENGNAFLQGSEIKGMTLRVIPSSGMPDTIHLAAQCSDAWGKVLWKKELSASGKETANLPLQLPGDRLGVFDVTIVATGPDKKELGKAQSRYAVIRKVPASNLELPLFGAHIELFSAPSWLNAKYIEMLKLSGAGMNRCFISSNLPSGNGVEAALQTKFETAAKMGIGPQILCVGSGTDKIYEALTANDTVSKEAVDAYVTYLKSYVIPLQKQVRCWEILNESNIWRFKDGPKKGQRSMPPERYITILKASYEAIKAIDPELKVVGICLNSADFDYLNKVMKLGAGKYMDVFSFHSYRGSPDIPDTYKDLVKMKKILRDNGFNGPIINDEQYYAANLSMLAGSDEETSRDYYVPGDQELWGCARTVQNYLHHAAAGIPHCAFAPGATQLNFGGYDKFFLFYLYGAYNAEAALLTNAGEGVPFRIGDSMKAFLFKDAPEGPLLAFYAPDPKVSGKMKLGGTLTAYDMMGNPFTPEEIRNGLPISVAPIYLQFPKGTSLEKIKEQMTAADIGGLGDPFALKLVMKDDHTLGVMLLNMQNKTLNGDVVISTLPDGWKLEKKMMAFTNLKANDAINLEFKGDLPMTSMAEYRIGLVASSDDKFTKKQISISPLFADYKQQITVDGNLDDWKNVSWINLGEENLSRNFNEKVPHKDAADLSAKVAFAWNEQCLVVALEVTDDAMVFPETPATAWASDSVQIYFDQLQNAVNPDSVNDSDDIIYTISATANGKCNAWLTKGCDGRYIGEANQATGLDAEVEVASSRTGSKVFYEIKFPAKCLPMAALQQGNSIGFSLLINDSDGAGRKTGLTLSPKGTEPANKPYFYKSLILRSKANP